MSEDSLHGFARPVVELPVEDVERAQQHYYQALGFQVARLLPDKTLERKPWGLHQFSVADLDGHRLNFHHDA